MQVDLLGHDRGAVAHQVGDLLDGYLLSLMIDTNEWRSSRGVQHSPRPAALVIRRNERRTLAASSGVPTPVEKTRSLSSHVWPTWSRYLACWVW
jgi:hypothetical protein